MAGPAYVVTGANRGIGIAICRLILERDNTAFVWMACRNEAAGQKARESMPDGHRARASVVQLDVTSKDSIQRAVDHIKAKGGAIFCLINNAGVCLGVPWTDQPPPQSVARDSLDVNFYGLVDVTEAFLPLLQPHSNSGQSSDQVQPRRPPRIVNVSSGKGTDNLARMDEHKRRQFLDTDLTMERLDGLAKQYLEAFKRVEPRPSLVDGWWLDSYGFSKACANAYTLILSRQRPDILVNACTPGMVDTDMVKHYKGMEKRTPEEGADIPVWLAMDLEAEERIGTGRMVRDKDIEPWVKKLHMP